MTRKQVLGRRDFMKLAGIAGAGATLAACAPAPAAAPAAPAQQAAATTAPEAPAAGTSGGPSPDTEATITIFNFGGDADKKVYADAGERFKKRFPKVTIVDNFTPVTTWSEYTNKVATQVAGGNPPDIINIAIEGAALLQSKGLLMPLDNYMNSDPAGKELVSDVDPALIKPFQIKGNLWLVPHSWNNMVIHYNTKIFEDAKIEPPKADWTWDDFLATAKALTTGEGDNKVWGFAIPYFNFGLHPWWLTNGTYQLSDDWTKSNLDDPKMLESVTFVRDLVHTHKVSPDVKGADNVALFTTGKVAMSGWGHWPIQTFLANDFKDFAVQYFPRNTAGTSVFGVGGWGIYPQTKNPDLSWELIKELTSKETIDATAKVGVAIPARRSVAESKDFLAFPPNSEIFYGSLQDAKPVASPANFTELETIFMRHMDEIMTDAVTPEAGLKAAHEELSAAMAKLQS